MYPEEQRVGWQCFFFRCDVWDIFNTSQWSNFQLALTSTVLQIAARNTTTLLIGQPPTKYLFNFYRPESYSVKPKTTKEDNVAQEARIHKVYVIFYKWDRFDKTKNSHCTVVTMSSQAWSGSQCYQWKKQRCTLTRHRPWFSPGRCHRWQSSSCIYSTNIFKHSRIN